MASRLRFVLDDCGWLGTVLESCHGLLEGAVDAAVDDQALVVGDVEEVRPGTSWR